MSKHRIMSTEPLKRLLRTLVKNHCGRCFAAFFRGGCFATFLEGGPGATAPLAPYKNHHFVWIIENGVMAPRNARNASLHGTGAFGTRQFPRDTWCHTSIVISDH